MRIGQNPTQALGFDVLLKAEQFLASKCKGDSRLVVTKSTTGTAGEAAEAFWREQHHR